MYIPYQFLLAIENDRLRTAVRCQVRAEAAAARRTPRGRRLRHGLGGRVTRTFGRRPAAGAVA